MTLTIVSGAAPGVEQGAIEAAVNLALHWQGVASHEHLAALPAIYRAGLQPTSATDPGMVRRLNIQDADGALVFSTSMVLVGVPAFVDRWTEKMGRAFLHVTLNPAALQSPLPAEVVERVRAWLRDLPGRVYVTGPSADDVPGIQGAVRDALIAILEPFAVEEVRQTTRMLDLVKQAAAVGGQPTHIAINPANADAAIAAGLDVQFVPMDPATDPRYSREHGDAEALAYDGPTDCQGEPLDLGPDDFEVRPPFAPIGAGWAAATPAPGFFEPESKAIVPPPTTAEAIGWGRPIGPPEGLDEIQRAQLDASIREAERDIRDTGPPWQPGERSRHRPDLGIDCIEMRVIDPVEERMRAYHEIAATAPGPIGVAEHEDDEPPAPGDQTA